MTRKSISLVLALTLILSCFVAAPALAKTYTNLNGRSTTVSTTKPGDTLRIRQSASKGDTPTVDYVRNNQAIILITEGAVGPENWSRVRVTRTGAIGYLKNKYIQVLIDARGYDNSDGEIPDGSGGSDSGKGDVSSLANLGIVVTNYGGSVNVRRLATSSSASLGTAATGEHLQLLGSSGNWFLVRTAGGLRGYIFNSFVQVGIPASTTASVNLRTGAGTGFSVIRTLASGTSIRVIGTSGNWYRVRVGSSTGFLFSSYTNYWF